MIQEISIEYIYYSLIDLYLCQVSSPYPFDPSLFLLSKLLCLFFGLFIDGIPVFLRGKHLATGLSMLSIGILQGSSGVLRKRLMEVERLYGVCGKDRSPSDIDLSRGLH